MIWARGGSWVSYLQFRRTHRSLSPPRYSQSSTTAARNVAVASNQSNFSELLNENRWCRRRDRIIEESQVWFWCKNDLDSWFIGYTTEKSQPLIRSFFLGLYPSDVESRGGKSCYLEGFHAPCAVGRRPTSSFWGRLSALQALKGHHSTLCDNLFRGSC